ncbi:MAG: pantetheine-phosphate adenylyltransferase [Candidatus Diapherotrites archaeon]|nr:pantetheine-phosphate adenylyltransferase [Candidatus Diapherotrites archaeon]
MKNDAGDNGRIAVYAGTFDPITLGHVDVIKRAVRIFNRVIVAITTNPRKTPLFTVEERVQLAKDALAGIENVEVESFTGLLVNYMKRKGAKTILRGLREVSDFSYEFQQAIINRKLYNEVDTVFIMTSPEYFYINSTIVKELVKLGACVKGFVPENVEIALKKKLSIEK